MTFLYRAESPGIKNKRILRSRSGCKLTIENIADEIVEVADDMQWGTARNGEPAAGKFKYNINYKTGPIDCENDQCKISEINLFIGGTIQLHSENWFKDNYGQNYEDGFVGCIKNCILQHEEKHKEDAYK